MFDKRIDLYKKRDKEKEKTYKKYEKEIKAGELYGIVR